MNALTLLGFQIARVVILTSVDDAPAKASDVRARVDQRVQLFAAIELVRPGSKSCAIVTTAEKIASRCKRLDPPAALRVAWTKIEAAEKAYDNVPDGEFSPAAIDWVESPWTRDAWSVPADVAPIVRAPIAHGAPHAGTMRYRVAITLEDGRVVSSTSMPEHERGGPRRSEDARKVSLRNDDTYLGYMTELGGLPYIFGSTELGHEPHQAERAIGADCADLMIYGLRRLGHNETYRSSRTLGPVSRSIVRAVTSKSEGVYLDEEGKPVRIGTGPGEVRPGDWLIFPGHVGAFFEDRGQIGVLDEADLMMHIAWRELAVEPMTETGYADVPFEVRRASSLGDHRVPARQSRASLGHESIVSSLAHPPKS